jgi:Holliday junction resolvase
MNSHTFAKLQEIHQRYGPQEFGKICQKLLAIAFRSCGYGHVVERGVQGVDVDAAQDGGERYSLEVKTTEKDSIVFGRKDEEGLSSRAKDGYRPLLAVLQLGPLSEWYFVDSKRVRVGTLTVESLRPYRQRELEQIISPLFEDSVRGHHSGIMNTGQEYLDKVLRGSGVRVEDK